MNVVILAYVPAVWLRKTQYISHGVWDGRHMEPVNVTRITSYVNGCVMNLTKSHVILHACNSRLCCAFINYNNIQVHVIILSFYVSMTTKHAIFVKLCSCGMSYDNHMITMTVALLLCIIWVMKIKVLIIKENSESYLLSRKVRPTSSTLSQPCTQAL